MNKNKYYINVGTQEISLNHDANNDDFVVYATEEEIIKLREIFDEVYNSDMRSFFRAHIPAMPYHQDQDNDDYDVGMKSAFRMIHDLGDEMTREHIEQMKILED
ncbi:hydrolase [Halobacillus halophilus]|uniref:hydrolase n=1 Tax=Halobacillus halophilus TaxID=1570 RepID=UPI001CD79B48|nr:hydrolase [Halobacillus halophilus]MCA1011038.1 hydrolase [Halobacillus halophilus]